MPEPRDVDLGIAGSEDEVAIAIRRTGRQRHAGGQQKQNGAQHADSLHAMTAGRKSRSASRRSANGSTRDVPNLGRTPRRLPRRAAILYSTRSASIGLIFAARLAGK